MKNLYFLLFFCSLFLHTYGQLTFTKYDLNPGSSDAVPFGFTEYNGKLFFVASDSLHGRALWVIDGTAPPILFADINPGTSSGNIFMLGIVNGKLLFSATDSTQTYRLWRTDGTVAGTQLVKDIRPSTGVSNYIHGLLYNGLYYFPAYDSLYGTELWATDGTTAGTRMIADINPGVSDSEPTDFFLCNGKLHFTAHTLAYGDELWITDGTSSGTHIVKDLYTGSRSGILMRGIGLGIVFKNKHYFYADDGFNNIQLCVSDGTANGTKVVKVAGTGMSYCGHFREYNNKFYYTSATAGLSGNSGAGMWESDGTDTGTHLMKDVIPDMPSTPIHGDLRYFVYRNKLYFAAGDYLDGLEPWVTDGTATGTHQVANINPNLRGGSDPLIFNEYNNRLYFIAQATPGDYQLYRSDGTTANTVKIAPAYAPRTNPLNISYAVSFFVYNSTLYFSAAYDSSGYELWALKDTSSFTSVPVLCESNTFSIYPNPNNGTFTIEATNDFKNGMVSVYDMMGRLIKSEKLLSKSETISINAPKGIYLVKLQLDHAVMTKRVVVE